MLPTVYKRGDSDVRPWGSWVVLDMTPQLVVKKLVVNPGARISLQRHKYRSERWIVMQGEASVQKGDETIHLCAGDGVLIAQDTKHRLLNTGKDELYVLEIQFGDLLSEDDIERLEDDYGRKEKG